MHLNIPKTFQKRSTRIVPGPLGKLKHPNWFSNWKQFTLTFMSMKHLCHNFGNPTAFDAGIFQPIAMKINDSCWSAMLENRSQLCENFQMKNRKMSRQNAKCEPKSKTQADHKIRFIFDRANNEHWTHDGSNKFTFYHLNDSLNESCPTRRLILNSMRIKRWKKVQFDKTRKTNSAEQQLQR